jgi:hypothetical protein
MAYKVGQVIYLIHPQKLAVVPAQIVEQIIKRTVSGEETVYNLQPPGDVSQVTLSSFDGEVFENLGSVREYLLTNAQKHIEAVIERTGKTVESNFDIPAPEKTSRRRRKSKKVEDPNALKVDLGNGQVGNIKISEDLQKLVE